MSSGAEFRVGYPEQPPLLPGVRETEQHELWAAHEGARLRRFPLEPQYWEMGAAVDIAAERACHMLAQHSAFSMEEIRTESGDCGHLSVVMQQLLQRRDGIDTQLMEFTGAKGHFFLRSTNIPGETFDYDGTWLQFAFNMTDFARQPHTLIIPASQRRQAVVAHEALRPYVNYDFMLDVARPVDFTYKDFLYEPLRQVFESEGWAQSS